MKRFTQLFLDLDQTNRTNEKVSLLKAYFLSAPDEDKLWALALFTGRRPKRMIRTSLLHQWTMEEAGIPEWLLRESYGAVGDLAETISLLLPSSPSTSDKSLSEWFRYFAILAEATDEEKRGMITSAWKELSTYETFVFNKLLLGNFRIGVSDTLVIRAVAQAAKMEPAVVTHRVMGSWLPGDTTFDDLIHADNPTDQTSQPYPFYLAYALEGGLASLGKPAGWFAEWKWDGIRSQIIFRRDEYFIWSRGEDLMTAKFPELHPLIQRLPAGTVLDGEIVCYQNGRPMPFGILQTRIGRKNVTQKILSEAPVAFIAYDLLETDYTDVRSYTQSERRSLLEKVFTDAAFTEPFLLSPLITFTDWNELASLHASSRENAAEGFMLKRKDATYQVGRKKGDWWKWKVDPLSVDAVLVYAQKGSGRRADLFTDYTFAVWDNDKLIPFAKAYSGLTDAEIRQVDRFVRQHTLEKFGPVRTVEPNLVFEIGFEGINASARHKSGIAVRFPRILRWRTDKTPSEADNLDELKKLLREYG